MYKHGNYMYINDTKRKKHSNEKIQLIYWANFHVTVFKSIFYKTKLTILYTLSVYVYWK